VSSELDIQTVGIIGLGSFGQFVVSLLPAAVKVLANDPNQDLQVTGVERTDLKSVCGSDVLILAIPLSAYPQVLKVIAGVVDKETLVVDTCSVKALPQEYFDKYLSNHRNILLLHPLFGPQSAADSTIGHRLIVTRSGGQRATQVLNYCTDTLGLVTHRMSAEEHDRAMARIHALTFFVARGLGEMGLDEELFMTPSYRMITDLVRLDASHSQELFQTIEQGNPFAKDVRKQLIERLTKIDETLND
jgi:prephenate dehydrogenase